MSGVGAEAAEAAAFGHSPSLPNRHAKFRDVVEIVEFGEKDKVKTGVHFAHEEQLHDDDDDVGDFVDDDHTHTSTTVSECSSTSDDLVLFFAPEDDDCQDKVSTARSECSTNGSDTPDLRLDDSAFSPLLSEDEVGDASDNVLKNIFTSLSCRSDTATPKTSERQQTVKHVRLMDRVEPVEREEEDYS